MTDPFSIRRICIWGGPGIGKSTCAARIYGDLKVSGYSVEICQEYVKAWAYEKREIGSFDQCYIFAKQQRLEDRVLRAGVKLIVTDSPLLMQCVYARRYNFIGWQELLSLGKLFNTQYPAVNFLLNRKHGSYQTEGRYQNEQEAKELDAEIETFMKHYAIPFERIDNDATQIVMRVADIVKNDSPKGNRSE